MLEIILVSILAIFAALSAFAVALTVVGSVQVSSKVREGILQYLFVGLLLSNGLAFLVAGKLGDPSSVEMATPGPSALASWIIRFNSIFVIIACLDQFFRYVRGNPVIDWRRLLLIAGVVCMFCGNVISPALFGKNPVSIESSWFYGPMLGVGIMCLSQAAAQNAVLVGRNALVVFTVLSLALIPILPASMLQLDYSEGFLPGVPRFTGLAPHAIMMGMLCSIALWCMIVHPFSSVKIHRFSLAACLLALFLAQSKTVWFSFILSLPVLYFFRVDWNHWKRKRFGDYKLVFVLGCLAVAFVMLTALALLITGFAEERASAFSRSSAGHQVLSLTGRDVIWRHAIEEWKTSPLTGYGLPLFNEEYRARIRHAGATSGHNQFIDALGRAGGIGAVTMAVYYCILSWFGFRYSRATNGLSTVLTLSMLVRSISELPIRIFSLGIGETPHLLLLILIVVGLWQDKKSDRRVKAFAQSRHTVSVT
ncbi:O-antigen ligase family protein [Xylophilus sp. GOD-11R]|uniref:O-antigen ligase family protein n=1 Tax=Xylophilus sp. GOD-11R TaxID=3089814 RepID=UPI00298C14CD|nr:O-antigen ligase family protein [Xylophilus sp. GOD-11R]WPB58112.1 O-antigen ligase family protein [Xylophilus sp. GOD-11R]